MPRNTGNTALRSARLIAGYTTRQGFAEALTQRARQQGIRITITERTVRRWESDTPGWPRDDAQRALTSLLNLPMENLGFTPPWSTDPAPQAAPPQIRTTPTLSLIHI